MSTPAHTSKATLSSHRQAPQHWAQVANGALDIAFEADRAGRLLSVSPSPCLGRQASALIGQPIGALLGNSQVSIPPDAGQIRRRVSGVDAAGRPVECLLSCNARPEGVRGGLIMMDASEVPHADLAALRRVCGSLRAGLVPRIGILAGFETLASELACDGAVLLTTGSLSPAAPIPDDGPFHIVGEFGTQDAEMQRIAADLSPSAESGMRRRQRGNTDYLLVRERVRLFGQIAILAFRKSSKPWSGSDGLFCRASLEAFASAIELDGVHRNLLRNAHFDPSFNVLTWGGLNAEISRRIIRLDRDHLAATLMVVAVEGLDTLVASLSCREGDDASRQSIEILRNAVRPTDLVARLGSDIFALWMDGADRFAAAERAERITAHGAPILLGTPHHLTLRIGLVAREPMAPEQIETFLERASLALHEARAEKRSWAFSHEAA